LRYIHITSEGATEGHNEDLAVYMALATRKISCVF